MGFPVRALRRFLGEEDGAITVDWVVLTATIIGLALAAYLVISGGVDTQSTAIDTELTGFSIKTSFD